MIAEQEPTAGALRLPELTGPRVRLRAWRATDAHAVREASHDLLITSGPSAGYEREGLLRAWERVAGEPRDMHMYGRLTSQGSACGEHGSA